MCWLASPLCVRTAVYEELGHAEAVQVLGWRLLHLLGLLRLLGLLGLLRLLD